MAAADVVITKSGGLTTSEAMTIGVPMGHVHPIRAARRANADFFERYGLARYVRELPELGGMRPRAADGSGGGQGDGRCAAREIDPRAAEHFARALIEMVQARQAS